MPSRTRSTTEYGAGNLSEQGAASHEPAEVGLEQCCATQQNRSRSALRDSLECVVNISTGEPSTVKKLENACKSSLLDVHSDIDHNRSVFTLFGADINNDLSSLCREAYALINLSKHAGVHPRFGVVDVVPFVPYKLGQDGHPFDLNSAITARNEFARFAAEEFGVNVYLYGPERNLPDTRRAIQGGVAPSFQAGTDESRGSICVGARNPLVAYNLIVKSDLAEARKIAIGLRSENVRTLVFDVKSGVQLSANLVAPWIVGPIDFYEMVAAQAAIVSAELVGLVPAYCIKASDEPLERYGLSPSTTIESRMAARN